MTPRAWDSYSRLQDHITAIRDHVSGAEACLGAMPWEDTIPEGNYRALAKELRVLAETCERRADRRAKKREAA